MQRFLALAVLVFGPIEALHYLGQIIRYSILDGCLESAWGWLEVHDLCDTESSVLWG